VSVPALLRILRGPVWEVYGLWSILLLGGNSIALTVLWAFGLHGAVLWTNNFGEGLSEITIMVSPLPWFTVTAAKWIRSAYSPTPLTHRSGS
jgi:hypothetical protein